MTTNPHTSFSQVKRYDECPKSFELHYRRRLPALPSEPATFGRVIHKVCERLVLDAQKPGAPVTTDQQAMETYAGEWRASGLSGLALFDEGRTIVRNFLEDGGAANPARTIAVEAPFELPAERFRVIGFIDRVDRLSDDAIEIIDYKTNQQLFTRDELENDVQLSLYRAAAKVLWPWAKTVKLTYWMLRHRVRMPLVRTEEQADAALAYVQATAEKAQAARSFPAKTGAHCCYCDHRDQCDAYAEALRGKRSFVCADLTELEAVAKEREEVAGLVRVLDARKRELEGVLRVHLKDRPELALAGMRYRLLKAAASTRYPLGRTLDVLRATGMDRAALLDRIAVVDKEALEGVLEEAATQMPRRALTLLRAELEATAERTYVPRFAAAEQKSASA